MKRTLILIIQVGVLFSISTVTAHHGLEGYDTDNVIELNGTVVGFELMDPHSMLFVDVINQDATVTRWVVEGGAASGIISSGLTREFLNGNPSVLVKAYQSKDGLCSPRCRASGREFDFQQN